MYNGNDLEQKLYALASCDPTMSHFLGLNRPSKVYLVDEKCGLFSIEGIGCDEILKYVVSSKGRDHKEIINPFMQTIVKRGLRAQMTVQGLEGVQVLRSPDFFQRVVGLLGPFQYLSGCNLSHIDYKTFPELDDPSCVFGLFEELDRNIQEVHKRNISHGDVKPGNIVYSNNKLVLIDWISARTFKESLSSPGPQMITPRYYYPLFDRSLDFWALSLSFVDVLKIRFPFEENTVREASDDLVDFLFQKLTREFGAEYGVFYTDLVNRLPEVVFNSNSRAWQMDLFSNEDSIGSTSPLEIWESK